MKVLCYYCKKELERPRYLVLKRNCYCNTSCQLNYEYEHGIRDKNEIIKKGRKVAHKKMKEHNWLNDKDSRDKLKEIMSRDDYKKKCRDCKLGKLNPMFGKKPWNYVDGRYRKYGVADRGYNWKEIKENIKVRDNYTCQICGSKKNLQVHHFEPYKSTQNNEPENLVTVCSKCHGRIENQFYKVQDVKSEFVEKEKVYNIEVEDDHTYIVEGHIVHNCRSRIVFELE